MERAEKKRRREAERLARLMARSTSVRQQPTSSAHAPPQIVTDATSGSLNAAVDETEIDVIGDVDDRRELFERDETGDFRVGNTESDDVMGENHIKAEKKSDLSADRPCEAITDDVVSPLGEYNQQFDGCCSELSVRKSEYQLEPEVKNRTPPITTTVTAASSGNSSRSFTIDSLLMMTSSSSSNRSN